MPKFSAPTVNFVPWNLPVWFLGLALGFLLLLAPMLWSSGVGLNFISQACIASIFALSFNMLLGQTGMLSFGHAVYSGLGAFIAIHTMNKISAGSLNLPMSLVPLVGGLAGAFFGLIFGWISTKKSGITFSMISLGIGELVFASSLMFPSFFGGEGGISANRVSGSALMGITFGPQIEVTYLLIAWTILAAWAMYFIRITPFGKLAAAVRDNPERLAFIGFNPRWVRLLMLILAGFFAGIAGALSAINFEIVTAENVSALRSGSVLLFTYIGGVALFFGPVIGALLGIVMSVFLSELTPAWSLYMGLLFILIVSFAPHGLSGLAYLFLKRYKDAKKQMKGRFFLLTCIIYSLAISLFSVGLIMLIETLYRLRLGVETDTNSLLWGFIPTERSFLVWFVVAILVIAGTVILMLGRRFQKKAFQQTVQRTL